MLLSSSKIVETHAQSEFDSARDDGGAFPASSGDVVSFEWADDDGNDEAKRLTGRRKKIAAKKKAKPGSFETMGLSEPVLKSIRRMGYRLPTPIQRKSLPLILQGLDVVGMARTGSGKTAAFVIPLIERLKSHAPLARGSRAVILSPTRELALQTHKVVRDLGKFTDLRTAILVGGDSLEAQFAELASSPDIIVATPGRLVHHLGEIKTFTLKAVEYAVFDEADRLFEMGFAEQIQEILNAMPSTRQTLLFSATMPRLLAEFARAGLRDPELVRLDVDTKLSPDLKLAFFTVRPDEKPAALLFLLRDLIPQKQSTIVFTATRHHVEFLSQLCTVEGLAVAAVHGAMDQAARKINIAKFRAGKSSVLIVTDVAARGLDIPLLDNVVNYDFPPKPKLFVHRAGRAARAGRSGTAFNFVTREEIAYLMDLHLYLSRPLKPASRTALNSKGNQKPGEEGISNDFESIVGCFPQTVLDAAVERVRDILATHSDLESQMRSLNNAMRLYIKTRPPSAPESSRRAKEWPREGIHPLLAAAVPTTALCGLETRSEFGDIAEKLRSYRPAATVLETEVGSAQKVQGIGAVRTRGLTDDVMRKKRRVHQHVITKAKATAGNIDDTSNVPANVEASGAMSDELEDEMEDEMEDGRQDRIDNNGLGNGLSRDNTEFDALLMSTTGPQKARFREEGFYISHVPGQSGGWGASEGVGEKNGGVTKDQLLQDAVLDLTAEDADGIAQARSSAWHWDKKSKKYVKLQKNETIKAGKRVRNESGAVLKDKQNLGATYERWSKRTKMAVGGGGSRGVESGSRSVNSSNKNVADAMKNRFVRGGRGWKNPFKGAKDDENLQNGMKHGKRNSSELRTVDQVRKIRKDAARKAQHLKRRRAEAGARRGGKKGKGRGRG